MVDFPLAGRPTIAKKSFPGFPFMSEIPLSFEDSNPIKKGQSKKGD
jgi:hypothetical protein